MESYFIQIVKSGINATYDVMVHVRLLSADTDDERLLHVGYNEL